MNHHVQEIELPLRKYLLIGKQSTPEKSQVLCFYFSINILKWQINTQRRELNVEITNELLSRMGHRLNIIRRA